MAAVSVIKGVMNGSRSSIDFLYSDFHKAIFQHDYHNVQFPFTFWGMFFFGLLSAEAAKNTWIVCNLLLTVALVILLRKTFFKDMPAADFLILSLMMISGGAWRTNISNGQYKILFMVCFLLAVLLARKDDDIAAGLFLSMTAFQYTLAVPLGIYFLYKKKYKVIISAAAFLAVSFIGNALWFGGIRNITLRQLECCMVLTEEGDTDIQSILGLGDHMIPIFAAGVLFLLLMAYFVKWKPEDDGLFLSIAMMTAYAFAYQRIYNYYILIIPLGVLWMMYNETSEDRLVLIGLVLMFLFTVSVFYSRTVSEEYGLMLSRIFFYPAYLILMCIGFRRGLVFNER